MNEEQHFRLIFSAVFLFTFSISIYFRRQARQAGEVIRRADEGRHILVLRVLFAAPLYLSMLAYMINPDWMNWSTLRVPGWLRWLAALVGVGMLPMVYWQMRSIGRNISETFLTKENHVLVTHGPYRWIRHPLYAVSTVILVALSLVAANGFMLAMTVLSIFIVAFFVIPQEEKQLILKFGEAYREYQRRTGRLLPRLR
jgi:protein-S-isoprenylcysteine O-methyltransferase Ste14